MVSGERLSIYDQYAKALTAACPSVVQVYLGIQQLELSSERTEEILDELKSSDYENLIKVFDKYFGKLIDLER